jgi:SAM-dependent methyltransferase
MASNVDDAILARPIPVSRGETKISKLKFWLRSIADLQLLTCFRYLKPRLGKVQGVLLDVGCGNMPYRGLLKPDVKYVGIDVPQNSTFLLDQLEGVVTFDGVHIPFPNGSFDFVLCTEVIEHCEFPEDLVAEIYRVLRDDGLLIATIPFSARVHYAPYDYQRYTRFGLERLFRQFGTVEIEERGNDWAVICNKLVVVCLRNLRELLGRRGLVAAAALVFAVPLAIAFLIVAHGSMMLGMGSRADPLGYGITARRPTSQRGG